MKPSGKIRISGGDLRGQEIRVPPGMTVRPMRTRIRESLFGALGDRLRGARFLDVFAGSGAIGIEAVSRGAWQSTLVELDPTVGRNLKANLDRLGLVAQCRLIACDVYDDRARARLVADDDKYSLIFLDPPFGDYHTPTPQAAWRCPWRLAEALGREVLAEGGWLGLEYPTDLRATLDANPEPVAPDPTTPSAAWILQPPAGFSIAFDRTYGDTSVIIWERQASDETQ